VVEALDKPQRDLLRGKKVHAGECLFSLHQQPIDDDYDQLLRTTAPPTTIATATTSAPTSLGFFPLNYFNLLYVCMQSSPSVGLFRVKYACVGVSLMYVPFFHVEGGESCSLDLVINSQPVEECPLMKEMVVKGPQPIKCNF